MISIPLFSSNRWLRYEPILLEGVFSLVNLCGVDCPLDLFPNDPDNNFADRVLLPVNAFSAFDSG